MAPFSILPDLCLLALFRQMTLQDQIRARQVCFRWSTLVPSASSRLRSLTLFVGRGSIDTFEHMVERTAVSARRSALLLLNDDGSPMYPVKQLNAWNLLKFTLLDEDTVQQLCSLFTSIHQLQIVIGLENDDDEVDEQLGHLISLLVTWRAQLVNLKLINCLVNLSEASAEQFFATINSLSALKQLTLDLNDLYLPLQELPILQQLDRFEFFSFSAPGQLVKILEAHTKAKPARIFLRGGGFGDDELEQFIALDQHLRDRFARLEFFWDPVTQPSVICSKFRSLTSLYIAPFDISFRQLFTDLAQLTQLVHLRLVIETVQPDDQEHLLLPQVHSLKGLELDLEMHSHDDLALMNIPWTMPNIQHCKMASKKLTILMHAMDGAGHLNACVGISQSLKNRGHRVIFLLNAAFKGQFSAFGFEEVLLERAKAPESAPVPTENVNPVKAFAEMILKSGMLNGKSPLEKLKEAKEKKDEDFIISLYNSSKDFQPQIAKAIADFKPDLIILDHFLNQPAILQSNVPWLYLYSANPLSIFHSPDLPPFTSGYPVDSDRALWDEFNCYTGVWHESFLKYQTQLYKDFGYEPKPEDFPEPGGFGPQCKYGYIYGYPEELDYHDVIDIPDKFIRVDAFCRETTESFELPEGFRPEDSKTGLIYFTLGSMGSVDVELMKKVTAVLAKTPYKIIVSKGPLADEYELPENCWGKGFLPQTRILPLVDLVITHGGNNTVTETFTFGKPMIVMPLFGDQNDNAQRIHEKGYGIRLEPYNFEEQQLLDAVKKLIENKHLKERLRVAAKRIAESNSKEKACIRMEQLVAKYSH